jgi:exonuclease VII large subunit
LKIVQTVLNSMHQLEKRLNSLGPEQVLARGYSITTDVQRRGEKLRPDAPGEV